jgi:hypothetical protein
MSNVIYGPNGEQLDVSTHNASPPFRRFCSPAPAAPASVPDTVKLFNTILGVPVVERADTDVLEIMGVSYSMDFFRALASLQTGQLFRFIRNEHDQMLIQIVDESEAAQIEASVLLQDFGRNPKLEE